MRDALVVTGILLVAGVALGLAGAPKHAYAKAEEGPKADSPKVDTLEVQPVAGKALADSTAPKPQANPVKALVTCAGCHGLTPSKNEKAGPPLFGIYGSKPIKASIEFKTWDDKSLNKFLMNPEKVDSTTRMFFKIRNPEKRAEVIAALKVLR